MVIFNEEKKRKALGSIVKGSQYGYLSHMMAHGYLPYNSLSYRFVLCEFEHMFYIKIKVFKQHEDTFPTTSSGKAPISTKDDNNTPRSPSLQDGL